MPYQILSDDGQTQTLQLDDGRVVQVASAGLSEPLQHQSIIPTPVPTPEVQQPLPEQVPPMNPGMPDGSAAPSQLNTIVPESLPTKPEAQSSLDKLNVGFEDQSKGKAKQIGADIQSAKEQATTLDTIVKEDRAKISKMQENENSKQAYLETQTQKYQDLRDKYLSTEIDPNRMWNNKSTQNKIFSAIAIGLGALGGSLDGSHQNDALGIIKDQINRDLDAQKLELEKRGKGIEYQGNLLGQLRAQFSDQRTAESAFRQMGLENAKLQLDQISQKYKAPQLQGQLEQFQGQLQQEMIKNRLELESKAIDNYTKANPPMSAEAAKAMGPAGVMQGAYDTILKANANAGSMFGFRNEDQKLVDTAFNQISNTIAEGDEKKKAALESAYKPISSDSLAERTQKLNQLNRLVTGYTAQVLAGKKKAQAPDQKDSIESTGFRTVIKLPNGNYKEVK